jgi:hypothetical protein
VTRLASETLDSWPSWGWFSQTGGLGYRAKRGVGLDKQWPVDSEISRMSDAELVSELAKQANELGVQIDLSYKFGEGE